MPTNRAWAGSGVLWTLALGSALVSCSQEQPAPATVLVPGTAAGGAVRTTEFQAGPARPAIHIRNPYEGDARALEQGRRYYDWFNCGGCHGGQGGGGIGPPFADDDWIYGGQPAQIFETIVKGRPNGMPSFGGQIPEDRIWMIAAYVRSLDPDAGEGDAQEKGPGGTGGREDDEERGAVTNEGGNQQESGPAEGGEHDRTQRSRSGSDQN